MVNYRSSWRGEGSWQIAQRRTAKARASSGGIARFSKGVESAEPGETSSMGEQRAGKTYSKWREKSPSSP